MKIIFCFLGGVGLQEFLLLGLYLFVIAIPIIIIAIVVIKVSQRRNATAMQPDTMSSSANTPILKNANKLKELKSLQERGIITSSEFETEKRKILDS